MNSQQCPVPEKQSVLHRLGPEDCIRLEHNLQTLFGSLFPDASGILYFPTTIPQGLFCEERGFRPHFLGREKTLMIPLSRDQLFFGLFQLSGVAEDAFQRFGSLVMDLSALCLTNAVRKKEQQSDPITGLYNRESFLSCIEQSLEMAAGFLQPQQPSFDLQTPEARPDFGLIVCSITNLPQLQAYHGFSFADAVLRAVAEAIQGLCPEQSLLSRCRSAVFAILIPGSGPVQSKKTAVKLQQHLRTLRFVSPVTRQELKVDAVFGSINYPQDLHGSQLRANTFEKSRIIMTNALTALERAEALHPDRVFPFSEMLKQGGTVISPSSGNRIRINLGSIHQAREGQRFLVSSPGSLENSDAGPPQSDSKGELMLIEVGLYESLADVLFLNEPRQDIEPGDCVTLMSTADETCLAPQVAGDTRAKPLSFQNFLWKWQRDRSERAAFSLFIVRFDPPETGAVFQAIPPEACLALQQELQAWTGSEALIGEYGAFSLIIFLPDIGPEQCPAAAQDLFNFFKTRTVPPWSIAAAAYPCLHFARSEILSACRKAIIHAQMLSTPRIACFNSQTLTISGDRCYAHNDLPGACREYSLALILEPHNLTARNSLGICRARLGQLTRAADAFQEVLQQEPDNPLALYNFGYVCIKAGDAAQGAACFHKCLEHHPGHVFSLLRLGLLAEEQDEVHKAREYYLQALNTPDGNKYAYRLLAKLDLKGGNQAKGRANLQQALVHNPQDAESMHILARLSLEGGQDLDIAESLARKSLALRPERLDFLEVLDKIRARRRG